MSGGGGLALCGTGTLHCWAETVNEVVNRFTDHRKIDRSKLMDDSAYRSELCRFSTVLEGYQ